MIIQPSKPPRRAQDGDESRPVSGTEGPENERECLRETREIPTGHATWATGEAMSDEDYLSLFEANSRALVASFAKALEGRRDG